MHPSTKPDLSASMRQFVSIENPRETLPPASVGEEFSPSDPLPGHCKHTTSAPYKHSYLTINYRTNCHYSHWKKDQNLGSEWLYRTIENKVKLSELLPTILQPDFLTVWVYGILYQVKHITLREVALLNINNQKFAVTWPGQSVYQVEVKKSNLSTPLTIF